MSSGLETTNPGKPTARRTVPDRPTSGATEIGVSSASEPGAGSRTENMQEPRSLAQPSMGGGSRTEAMPEQGWSTAGTAAFSRAEMGPVSAVPGPPPTMPTVAPIPDAFALLKALRHRWLLAVSAGSFFAVVASTITWFLLPTTLSLVTATAKIRVKSYGERSLTTVQGDRTDAYTFKRTQSDLITTHDVLREALLDPQVEALPFAKDVNAVENLAARIKVDMKDASEIIDVSMNGANPAEVTILVNAVVRAFIRDHVDNERRRKEATRDEYQAIRNENVKFLEEKLNHINTQKRLGEDQSATQNWKQTEAVNLFRESRQEFNDATRKLSRAKRTLELEKQRSAKGPKKVVKKAASDVPDYLIAEEMERDTVAQTLRKRVAELNNLIEGYRNVANTNSKIVQGTLKGFQTDLERAEAALKKREDELLPRIRKKLGSSVPVTPEAENQTIEQLTDQITLLEVDEKDAQKKFDQALKEVQKFYGKSTSDVEASLKEIDRRQEIAKSFEMELAAINLELKSPPRLILIQEAIEPRPKDPHRQTKTIFLAGLSAFLFVGFCTAWFEFRSQRIHSADEVVHGLGLRLLGTVPALPDRVRRHPLALDEMRDRRLHNLVTESFDGIRTMVLHEARQTPMRVVMVASAVSGEGKTTLSSHLALSLAHAGRRTLLIDCDLVHPTINLLYDQPLVPGICEVLRGETDPAHAIIQTTVPTLSLLPAGRYDRQVSQILAKGWVQALFDRLKEEYEFIVVDTCPVLSVANTLLIGQHVDGVVLSLLRDVSQVPRVYATYQRLASLGIRVVGCVFNKARSEVYGYYGYYGHGAPVASAEHPDG